MNDTPRTDEFETAYFEDSTSHVDDVFEYARKLERENAALRELIVKKGYIVTYFNGTIGLACDPYYKPEEAQP